MDLWVVAAATGAGYLAKYLQNSAGEKEELSESSSQTRDLTSQFCRLARQKESKYRDVFSRRDEDVTDGNYEISDILTLNGLQENVGERGGNTDYLDNGGKILYQLETNRLTRNVLLMSRMVQEFSTERPSPLESRLTTQLNKEIIPKTGYIFSPPPSPSKPYVGPLIANQTINGDTGDSFENGGDDLFFWGEKYRSRLSQEDGLVELPGTRKHKFGKGQMNIAGSGPLSGMVLFFAGIAISIISSIMANKREIDYMNAQLKHKENLVQDLHEEIEMKDKLNVKEIFKEDNQSMESNPELMSKIEAELEAELEKLELNITLSGLERISDYFELDPDFEADVVQGDLKIHMPLESNNDASETSANHTQFSNYAVSPWELSVRLHELIETRLEARIEELEQALKNSRKRHSIEWLRIISTKGSDNDEVGSCKYEVDDMDPPLCMSLSEEVLDDINEGYGEVIRMTDSVERTPYSI